jgi:hypothetical protein
VICNFESIDLIIKEYPPCFCTKNSLELDMSTSSATANSWFEFAASW